MNSVSIDFETYSLCDIKKTGAWRYAQDPSTEVLCLAISVNGAEPRIWLPGEPFPAELAAADEIRAWNAAFEVAIWHYVCTRLYGWPAVPIDRFVDSMAVAASFAFPMKLADAAKALGTEIQKDTAGTRLLNKFSKPRKPTKTNASTRIRPQDDPEDFDLLCAYCRTDVKTEQAVVGRLPRQHLSAAEQSVWLMDLKANMRGILVDVPMVEYIIARAEEHGAALEDECAKITGGFTSGQRDAILTWAAQVGDPLNGYTADDVKEALKTVSHPGVRRVLEIRQSLSKTSVKKFPAIRACVGFDGRIRGMTAYHGATTGRFAGRLVQLQNLPRGNVKKAEKLAKYVTALSLQDMACLADDPMELFSSLVRSSLIPSPGKQLFVADYANIEGRVLAWMAGQEDLVRQFAEGDDVYKHMAAAIYKTTYDQVTDDQRQVGKQAVLGCGYGMGWAKFITTCEEKAGITIPEPLAKATIDAYRTKNDCIPGMWYGVEKAAKAAVKAPGSVHRANMCVFKVEGQYLFIKLPSGRCLSYYQPRMRSKPTPWGGEGEEITHMGKDAFTGQWTRMGTYGGKLVENIVQAVARDILVYGMRCIAAAGYDLLTTVHDEIIAERAIGQGSVHEFETLMASLQPWADGCPVKAEGWSGVRYRK